MGFICGLLERNGKWAETRDIARMIEAGLSVNGGSIRQYLLSPKVKQLNQAIAGVAIWPYCQDLRYGRPLDLFGHLLTWDGRLDNREVLRKELESNGAVFSNTVSDDEIVAWGIHLYGGEVFVRKMIGDYVLVVANARDNDIFCARSPFGVRELYYLNTPKRFAWASNLAQILPILSDPIDEENLKTYIAEFLCCTVKGRMTQTPYKQVFKLLPGIFMRVKKGISTTEEIWIPDDTKAERHTSTREYEKRFRQIFMTAVRRRLVSCGKKGVTISLSGGLDSSSIACLLGHMRKHGETLPPIRLLTNVYPGQGDESEYAHAVAEHTSFPLEIARTPEKNWLLKNCDSFRRTPEPQESILESRNGEDSYDQDFLMPNLTGLGGDQILIGSPTYLGGFLKKLKLHSFFSEARRLAGTSRRPLASIITQFGLIPVLNHVQYQYRRRGIGFELTTKAFQKQFTLSERLKARYLPIVFSDPAAQNDYESLLSVHQWSCPGFSVFDTRTPYLDTDLVGFCLALPGILRNDGLRDRVIMRHALRSILPEKILQRTAKGSNEDNLTIGINKEWHRVEKRLGRFYLAKLGVVSNENMENLLRRAKAGALMFDVVFVIQILMLEFWLESLLGPSSDRYHNGPTFKGVS